MGNGRKVYGNVIFKLLKKMIFFHPKKKSSYGQFLVTYSTYIQVLSKEI